MSRPLSPDEIHYMKSLIDRAEYRIHERLMWAKNEINHLRAKIARVEALADEWQEDGETAHSRRVYDALYGPTIRAMLLQRGAWLDEWEGSGAAEEGVETGGVEALE